MIRSILLSLALGTPALADAHDPSGAIDFEALFAANSADVVELMSARGQSRWQLDLPGNVTVWADGTEDNRQFSANDRNPGGAAGCLWEAYIEVAQFNRSCPGVLPDEMASLMQDYLQRVGDFVADNTFPPVPRADFWAHWNTVIDIEQDLACDTMMNPESAQLVGTLASAQFAPLLDRVLETPRLPVTLPCF